MRQLPGHWTVSSVIFHLTVLVLSQCILVISASVLDFQTSPDHVIGGLTKSLTLNCSLSQSAVSGSIIGKRDVTQNQDNMAALTSLVVSKDGHDVAMVSSVSPARVTDGSTNVQVSGSVSGNSGSGFLQLTITDPTVDQTGEFLCEASGISGTGHGVALNSAVEIVNSEASLADLVAFVSDLSKENRDLNSKINSLEANEANLQQKIHDLEAENAVLKNTTNELKNKTELMVYFNARINSYPHYSRGQVVVFDDVEESKGNNYNRSNGLFTCSVPGYYHFTVGCLSESNKMIDLALYHNSQQIFHVFGAAGHSFQGNANAATLELASGDVVKVETWDDTTIDGPYCSFHGYLIKAL